MPWRSHMSSLWQDVRYAARMLRRSPGFTSSAILTLALGIGAATAIFSLAHALYFKPLPVKDPTRLVDIHQTLEGNRTPGEFPLSYADYLYYREHNHVFTGLAADYPTAPLHLVTPSDSSLVSGSVVTWNYFPLLGLRPAYGRFFDPEEDRAAGERPVAVISHELFRSRFAGSEEALGSTITINAARFTIVGVAPQGFYGAKPGVSKIDVWVPSAMFRIGYRFCDAFQPNCRVVGLIGRLKPGLTVADAQTDMEVLARQLETAHPQFNKGRGVRVRPALGIRLNEQAQYSQTATLLAVTVGLVLLTACANLSGLLLARGVGRRKEIAVRQAMGAARPRLIRQLLVESLMLALLGGAAGLLVAKWTGALLSAFYGTTYVGTTLNFELGLDPIVLAGSLLLSLVTTLLFGLIPALQTSRLEIMPVLKAGGLAGGTGGSHLRDSLIVVQVALSVVLVIGAALLVRSVRNLGLGPGYDIGHVAMVRIRPSLVAYAPAKARAFHQEVIRRLEALPGVVAASPGGMPPLPGWGGAEPVGLGGQGSQQGSNVLQARSNWVGYQYFKALNLSLVDGRAFDPRDERGVPAVILNQTLAHRLSPGGSIVGGNVMIGGQTHVVIGVARDAQFLSAGEEATPFFYRNYWQPNRTDASALDSMTNIRVQGDPRAMLSRIRQVIAETDPLVPTSEVLTLADRVGYHFRTVRGASTMLLWLGGVALLLSTVGLYSVLAFTVSQRTRELAIRVALGASQSRVARLVVGKAALLCGLGAIGGLAGAAVASRTLASLLYGVQSFDPLTFLMAPALLIAVGLLASYAPARRAASLDPNVALRSDL